MSAFSSDVQGYLDILLANEVRVDIMTLFHKNPGIMDSVEGLARRIGSVPEAIASDIDEIVKLGVVAKKKLGNRYIYCLDHSRDKEVQDAIANYLLNFQPGEKGW